MSYRSFSPWWSWRSWWSWRTFGKWIQFFYKKWKYLIIVNYLIIGHLWIKIRKRKVLLNFVQRNPTQNLLCHTFYFATTFLVSLQNLLKEMLEMYFSRDLFTLASTNRTNSSFSRSLEISLNKSAVSLLVLLLLSGFSKT